MKKLSSYLTAGIAATATFQSSDAATVVTLYGPGARTPSTTPATPVGIYMGYRRPHFSLNASSFSNDYFTGFTRGSDLKYFLPSSQGAYYNTYEGDGSFKGFSRGAQTGSDNYVNISINVNDGVNDGVYEAVGQFYLDGQGGGYLIALARNDDNSALSISAGKLAIDAVPEPSAIALLALGAGGMAMRRRRKVA